MARLNAARASRSPTIPPAPDTALDKSRTGIDGFDEITGGGVPKGRPTLVCGGPGCGKTVFATEFLVRGALQHDEPGVFVSFEETAEDLRKNVASLGFDLADLVERKRLAIEHVRVERSEIEETGEYDLEGLFIRIGYAIDSIGARRVVLDTIESLFSGLSNAAVVRAELRRLFGWLKDRGVTAVITGERGEGALTRQGLEEYVSDCVVLLDHRVAGGHSTRRLRIVKYRGSSHDTNEFPFLIDETGITVMPITSLGLRHEVSSERISSGIPRLDTMLGGGGYYVGNSVLITGTAGSGKSSIAAHFAHSVGRNGGRALYFAFEESESQIQRNMRSIGVDLAPAVKKGTLCFHAARPTVFGLEMHLASMHKLISEYRPTAVVVDPITNLIHAGSRDEVSSMVTRLIDYLKIRRITAVFTSLTGGGDAVEATEVGISSLMDTWLLLRNLEANGERTRGLYVLKSRGMAHSNQIREFVLTDHGVELLDVYAGAAGVLTGSARLAQQAAEAAEERRRRAELEDRRAAFERKRAALAAQIAALQAEIDGDAADLARATENETGRLEAAGAVRDRLGLARGEDAPASPSRRPARSQKKNGREVRT